LAVRLRQAEWVGRGARARRLAVAAELRLHLVGDALLLVCRALADRWCGIASIDDRHDVVHEVVDRGLQVRGVAGGDARWLRLGLRKAALNRVGDPGHALARARRVYRHTLSLGVAVAAEQPGCLVAGALDLPGRTLRGGRTRSRLAADAAQEERCRGES